MKIFRTFALIAVAATFAASPAQAGGKKIVKPQWTVNQDFIDGYELHREIERLEIIEGLKWLAKVKNWTKPVPLPLPQNADGAVSEAWVLGHDEAGSWVSDFVVVPVSETSSNVDLNAAVQDVSDEEFKALVENYQDGSVTLEQLRAVLIGR